MAVNCYKYFKVAVNDCKLLEMMKMAKIGCKWLGFTGNGWKWMDIAENG